MPTAQRGQARIDIAAPSDVVYDLITDVTRMGLALHAGAVGVWDIAHRVL
ncbi:hypothetical protein [Mycobacterium lacus]|nr:hypothetical protein [Mycobacterium lacus]MCV7123836.1 hypothetical protein [Mycobacterium lacus]